MIHLFKNALYLSILRTHIEFGSAFLGVLNRLYLFILAKLDSEFYLRVVYCTCCDLAAFTAQPLTPWVVASEFGLFLVLIVLVLSPFLPSFPSQLS